MLIATVLLALSVAGTNPEDIKIAAPDLEGVGLSAELRSFYTAHLGQKLQMRGLKVITAADIRALISAERQKELVGCGDSEACAVELGNALGADTLLTGAIAKLGTTFQINVKVISAVDGKPLAFYSGKALSEEGVTQELDKAAVALATTLSSKNVPRRPSASTATPFRPSDQAKTLFSDTEKRDGNFIVKNDPVREGGRRLLLGGLLGIATGSVLMLVGTRVPLLFVPGIILAGVGLLALPVGLVLYFIGKQERVPIAASVLVGDRNRFGFAFSWVF